MKEISVTNPISEFKVIKKNEVLLSQSIAFQIERNVKHARPVRLFFRKKSHWQIFSILFLYDTMQKIIILKYWKFRKNKIINFWQIFILILNIWILINLLIIKYIYIIILNCHDWLTWFYIYCFFYLNFKYPAIIEDKTIDEWLA